MSRYVTAHVGRIALDEIADALAAMGLPVQRERDRVMLTGSLECPGQPVDLRVEPGHAGAIEDFGFVADAAGVALVCGELDRERIEGELWPQVQRAVAEARVRAAASDAGIDVDIVRVKRGR